MKNTLHYKIGFWSAVLAGLFLTAFAAAFIVTMAAFPEAVEWRGIEAYAASYRPALMAALMLPPFLLAPALLTTFACLHQSVPQEKKTLSLLALVFTAVYAGQISFNYYMQLTVVADNIAHGNLSALGLFAFFNPGSMGLNLELLGYGLLSIGLVFAAPLFRGGKFGRSIFWLFLINGVLNAVYIFEPFVKLGGPPIVMALFTFSMPIAFFLLAGWFRSKSLKIIVEQTP